MVGAFDENRRKYRSAEIVASYARAETVSPCEKALFDRFVPIGGAVLDLGVGGGRTTRYLADRAGRYVGIDYSEAMIEACHRRFPGHSFYVADAKRMEFLPDASFDCVVFSFNGIDVFPNDDERRACFLEVARVLKSGGSFVFSSHHARVLAMWPRLQDAKPHQVAWRSLRALLQAAKAITSTSYIRGEGYAFDPADGGLLLYKSTPRTIRRQVESIGFSLEAVELAHCPRVTSPHFTHWIYYACRRT